MLISTENTEDFWAKLLSLPSWERGLKPLDVKIRKTQQRSLPSWERGLKHLHGNLILRLSGVAPLVGAWIETLCILGSFPGIIRRSPRGSVD